jgi:hypothetical protein
MAEINLTSFAEAMKTVYAERMTDPRLYHGDMPLSKMLKIKSKKKAQGSFVTGNVEFRPDNAFVVRDGNNANYGTAQTEGFANWRLNYMRDFYTFRIDLMAEESADGDAASWATPIHTKLFNLPDNYAYWRHRCMWVGSSMKWGDVADATSSTTIQVTPQTERNFRIGDVVDVLVADSGAPGNGITGAVVMDVNVDDPAAPIITLGKELVNYLGVDTTYSVYWTEGRNKGKWGLPDIISTANPSVGNYGNLDRTVQSWWKAQAIALTGSPALQLKHVQQLRNQVSKYARPGDMSKGPFRFFVSDFETHDYLVDKAQNDKRYTAETKVFGLWGDGVLFDGMAFVKDKHCPPLTIYGIDDRCWYAYYNPRTGLGKWDEFGGMLKPVPGADMVEAKWKAYGNVICTAPNTQGVLSGFVIE